MISPMINFNERFHLSWSVSDKVGGDGLIR